MFPQKMPMKQGLGMQPLGHRPLQAAMPMSGASMQPKPRLGLASGGFSPPTVPFYERAEARDVADNHFNSGLINSDTAGRTDRLPLSVAADSFVMPADVVSGLGQGNSLAGAKIMDSIVKTGPFGTPLPRGARGSGPPRGKLADGGGASDGISHVMLAGGEYLVHRDDLIRKGRAMRIGGKLKAKTDLAAGHEWARNFVDEVRKHAKKFLANAPKPKR